MRKVWNEIYGVFSPDKDFLVVNGCAEMMLISCAERCEDRKIGHARLSPQSVRELYIALGDYMRREGI